MAASRYTNGMFKNYIPFPKRNLGKLVPGSWILVGWRDGPPEVALVLCRESVKSKGDVSFTVWYPHRDPRSYQGDYLGADKRIVHEQVMLYLGDVRTMPAPPNQISDLDPIENYDAYDEVGLHILQRVQNNPHIHAAIRSTLGQETYEACLDETHLVPTLDKNSLEWAALIDWIGESEDFQEMLNTIFAK